MKRIKLLLLTAILGLSSQAYIANAKSDATAKAFELGQMKVVCEPDALESGDTAKCYIVGRPDVTGADYRVHGYVAQAYTTDYLTLVGAEKNENITNTDAAFSKATTTSGDDTIANKDNMPDVVKGFKCSYDSANAANAHSYGCGVFYTTNNSSTYAFTPSAILNNVNRDIIKDQGYGVIGSFTVKLDEDSKTNTCGEVCVAVWRMTTDMSYNDYKKCAAGGDDCEEPTNMQSPGNKGGYNCVELHQKSKTLPDSPEPDTPDTGAFVSYAILAAGAVIAISAIAMAKKNSKFNKI